MIVMLSNLMEGQQVSITKCFVRNNRIYFYFQEVCYQYWPNIDSASFGEFTIEFLDEERQKEFVIRILNIHSSEVSLCHN